MGPNQGLAYYLSDLGYDVWLGNSRGNRYSKRHITLNPKSPAFWNFSFHQIGTIDLPETIDYILEKTGQKKLMYVGFSQGTTQLFIMASEKQHYLKKINHVHALSPVVFLSHTQSSLFKFLSLIFASMHVSIINNYYWNFFN